MEIETYILTVYDADGKPIGIPAIQGRGIASVLRTSGNGSAGTADTYTITYTDNTTSEFTVQHGHTPEKGVDYFTEDDKTEMVNAVLEALPAAEGVDF